MALCMAGMSAGLWIDAGGMGVARLLAWCGQPAGGPWPLLHQHWQQWPATHAGMLAGALAAVPLRRMRRGGRRAPVVALACGAFCGACMVAGMDFGMALGRPWLSGGLSAWLAMSVGMAWGTLMGEALVRAVVAVATSKADAGRAAAGEWPGLGRGGRA